MVHIPYHEPSCFDFKAGVLVIYDGMEMRGVMPPLSGPDLNPHTIDGVHQGFGFI